MRSLIICSLLVLTSFGLLINDASAGRFGGGRGFGMMRSSHVFNHYQRTPRATAAPRSRSASSNRWRGAMTGFLIGSLFTSLFMGHGFGGALFSWLILGMAIFFIANFIRQRRNKQL